MFYQPPFFHGEDSCEISGDVDAWFAYYETHPIDQDWLAQQTERAEHDYSRLRGMEQDV